MGDVRGLIEEMVLLENKIGLLLEKREYAIKSGLIVKIDGRVYMSKEYINFLTKEIIDGEEERYHVITECLDNASIEELYKVYEDIAREPKDEFKMERILTIFDLIEKKEIDRERGR